MKTKVIAQTLEYTLSLKELVTLYNCKYGSDDEWMLKHCWSSIDTLVQFGLLELREVKDHPTDPDYFTVNVHDITELGEQILEQFEKDYTAEVNG